MGRNETSPTRSVALLAYDQCQGSAVGSMVEVLDIANIYGARGEPSAPPAFRWDVVSPDGSSPLAMGDLGLSVAGALAQVPNPDLIFIPGLHFTGDTKRFARQVSALARNCGEWLAEQYRNGAVLAASCAGVFVLAEAGLLDGRKATTSWWLEPMLRANYPRVVLREGEAVTRDGRILSSGAFSACLDLALQSIEYFVGPAVAFSCAKVVLIDATKGSHFPYTTLQAKMQHRDDLVLRAQSRIRSGVRQGTSIESLARELGVSTRTLNRRFHEALGCTPTHYLQDVRVDGAKRLLETTSLSVEEIMERVGYDDPSSFRKLFERITRVSPRQYRRMFSLRRK
jgi:transcriptional regulator GlxA family with amidase domain